MLAARSTCAHIDVAAILHNASVLAQRANSKLWAVVKADAYGHGAVEVARALAGHDAVHGFAVSLVEEGVQLREAQIAHPVLVMGPTTEVAYRDLVDRCLTPLVSEIEALPVLDNLGRAQGCPVDVHANIDTGMGRVGIPVARVAELLRLLSTCTGVRVVAWATHMACADLDDPNDPNSMTRMQWRVFEEVLDKVRAALGDVGMAHVANSAALRFSDMHTGWVRPGLALYGNGGGPGLRQAMRLSTRVAQLRDVSSGQSVSYGALWTATRPSRLAVLPIGYADGYPRRLTGSAEVLIRGRRCPVVGAISMDISIVDVTALGDDVSVGDEVVLLGSEPNDAITTSEFARRAGLLEYEVTCGVSKRVPRVYK